MRAVFKRLFYFVLISSLFVLSFPTTMRGGEILSVKEGDQVSNFTLEDLNGHNVSLIDYKDKPVLLLFMTTWIRDTWKMIPHMKEYYSLYNSSGLVIFNIDIMETRKKAEQFAKENNIPYPTLLDTDGEVSRKFGIFGVPIVVLIDRNGRIACWDCSDLSDRLKEQFNINKE